MELPVDEGEVREVTIETIGDQGDEIAKVERGYVVIVPDSQPGEQPTVEMNRVGKTLDSPASLRTIRERSDQPPISLERVW